MAKTFSQHATTDLSELEFESITNYLVKESIEIIGEEVDYFFLRRDKLAATIINEFAMDNLDLKVLRNQLNRVLYTKQDIVLLIQKIEKRIKKELKMVRWNHNFKFSLGKITWIEPGTVVLLLREEIKSLLYSAAVSKAVDLAWLKLSKQSIPTPLNKLAAKVKVGDLILSSVKVNRCKLRVDLNSRIIKLIEGSLKQYKVQLCKELSSQIYDQLFGIEKLSNSESDKLIKIQTA